MPATKIRFFHPRSITFRISLILLVSLFLGMLITGGWTYYAMNTVITETAPSRDTLSSITNNSIANLKQTLETKTLYLFSGMAIVLIPITILFSYIISRYVTHRIVNMSTAISRYTRGEAALALPVSDHDEIGHLARAFTNMHQTLQNQAQEITHKENHHRAILENLLDCAVTIDAKGLITSFNKSGESIFGWQANEVIGKNINMLMPQPHRDAHDGYLQHFLATGDEKIMGKVRQFEAVRKDGSLFPIELSVTYNRVGDEIYFHGLIRDITERKSAEQKLIANQVALMRSNEELEKFAYIASHDLQEPLRKVQTFCDRLSEKYSEKLDDRGREYLQRMDNAATRMRTLISDLLTFSRVNTRGAAFEKTDLNQVLAGVLDDLEVAIRESEAKIEYNDLPVIDADRLQIRQLLQNLVGNALKFRKPDQPPFIHIHAEPVEDRDINGIPTSMCRLTVSDNGIGFDNEYVEKIFEVFQRLHGRSEYDGTGVGLAICRRIAQRHGGNITANGQPGQGAEFVTTLRSNHADNNKD